MNYQIFQDIILIFSLSIGVVLLFQRLKFPTIIGFLLTGIIVGPYGFKLIQSVHEVEILAEIGVVILLFTIGIEFSLSNLLRIKRAVLIGGTLQVVFTITAVFGLGQLLKLSPKEALFAGFLIALSSTAIVLKLIQERSEVYSPQGSNSLAILIFQDMAIVPLILITPLLGKGGNVSTPVLFIALGKGIAILVLMVLFSKFVVPRLLFQVTRTRSRELFLLTILTLCLAVAWITHKVGLSPALGAFIAGLIISESEYSHQAFGYILPFRDAFASLFFVSIGMLFNPIILFSTPIVVGSIVLGVMVLKALIVLLVIILIGYPLRTAFLTAFYLCQVGEFAFILSKIGMKAELLSKNNYQIFIAISVITMAFTPLFISFSEKLVSLIMKIPFPDFMKAGYFNVSEIESEERRNHLIIVGYGINGRNLARAAQKVGIKYIIIEMNPETVRIEKAKGEPIFYGDAMQEEVLKHADIGSAKVLVIAIGDPGAIFAITENARMLSSKVKIIVRTRFVGEMKELYALGADQVIPEEFEASIEIFSRVLTQYMVPHDDIEKIIAEVRADGYEMFRSLSFLSDDKKIDFQIPDVEMETLRVCPRSIVIGKSLSEIDIRRKYEISLLAIRRDEEVIPNPAGQHIIEVGDLLVVMGKRENVTSFSLLLHEGQVCDI